MFDPSSIPQDLISAFKSKKGGLYVGAGLSQSVGLPDWGGLLSDLINIVKEVAYKPDPKYIEDLEKLSKDGEKFLILAQELKDYLKDDFRKYIIEKYADNCPPPSALHLEILKLPYKFIVTTNYDTLLENAYVRVNNKQAKVYTYKESSSVAYDLWNERPFILKAHGDASKGDNIVLTEKDYRQIIFAEPGYQSILQTLFISSTILFLGTSLSDPELKLLLSFIHHSFHGGGPKHYALISDDKMNSVEAENWRKNFNINIISYDNINNHVQIEEFINGFSKLIA